VPAVERGRKLIPKVSGCATEIAPEERIARQAIPDIREKRSATGLDGRLVGTMMGSVMD
jgi:hypothetical protein